MHREQNHIKKNNEHRNNKTEIFFANFSIKRVCMRKDLKSNKEMKTTKKDGKIIAMGLKFGYYFSSKQHTVHCVCRICILFPLRALTRVEKKRKHNTQLPVAEIT